MIGAGLLLLLAGGGWTSPILAMTPEGVHEAVEYGRTAPEKDLAQYPLHDEDTWHANFDTPFLRVAQLSAAMRKSDKLLLEDEVPAEFSAGQVNVYVHAKDDRERAPRSVSHVSLVEPGEDGHVENVIPPVSSSRYVRRVPLPQATVAPARIARSVKAVFPVRLFVPGNKLKVSFEDGTTVIVPLDARLFAGVR
jgi:hypothetical protein